MTEIWSTTFWPSNMKADHLRNFSFLATRIWKTRQTMKTPLNHFLFILDFFMYHTAHIWYEQEIMGHRAHLEAYPRALRFLLLVER
jgi:hypothetical protein